MPASNQGFKKERTILYALFFSVLVHLFVLADRTPVLMLPVHPQGYMRGALMHPYKAADKALPINVPERTVKASGQDVTPPSLTQKKSVVRPVKAVSAVEPESVQGERANSPTDQNVTSLRLGLLKQIRRQGMLEKTELGEEGRLVLRVKSLGNWKLSVILVESNLSDDLSKQLLHVVESALVDWVMPSSLMSEKFQFDLPIEYRLQR